LICGIGNTSPRCDKTAEFSRLCYDATISLGHRSIKSGYDPAIQYRRSIAPFYRHDHALPLLRCCRSRQKPFLGETGIHVECQLAMWRLVPRVIATSCREKTSSDIYSVQPRDSERGGRPLFVEGLVREVVDRASPNCRLWNRRAGTQLASAEQQRSR